MISSNFAAEKIGTRYLLLAICCVSHIYRQSHAHVVGDLANTHLIEQHVLIGVYPGLTDEMLEHMIVSFAEFLRLKIFNFDS